MSENQVELIEKKERKLNANAVAVGFVSVSEGARRNLNICITLCFVMTIA